MENVKQILDELDDGYKYFAIKKDGGWYKIEFDSFMVKDIERAQNICSELNQMLKNVSEGQEADTCENNALLPDVSRLACCSDCKHFKHEILEDEDSTRCEKFEIDIEHNIYEKTKCSWFQPCG